MHLIILGYVSAAVYGLVMGSFVGAQVWRLRARQLTQDNKAGESVDRAELKRLKPLLATKTSKDRSQCLCCGHELAARDLIPLISWLGAKGRCRHCKQPIGRFEPLIELSTAIVFVGFYHMWVQLQDFSLTGILLLIGGLAAGTMFMILLAYDAKWFLLPDVVMFPLIAIGLTYATYSAIISEMPLAVVGNATAGVLILGGLYLFLWLVSKGMWVGFGDVKLGVALGLFLLNWQLALLTLFLANLIGTLFVLPGLLSGRLSRKAQVPFGPFLIIGFFISILAGPAIINWYVGMSFSFIGTVLMV